MSSSNSRSSCSHYSHAGSLVGRATRKAINPDTSRTKSSTSSSPSASSSSPSSSSSLSLSLSLSSSSSLPLASPSSPLISRSSSERSERTTTKTKIKRASGADRKVNTDLIDKVDGGAVRINSSARERPRRSSSAQIATRHSQQSSNSAASSSSPPTFSKKDDLDDKKVGKDANLITTRTASAESKTSSGRVNRNKDNKSFNTNSTTTSTTTNNSNNNKKIQKVMTLDNFEVGPYLTAAFDLLSLHDVLAIRKGLKMLERLLSLVVYSPVWERGGSEPHMQQKEKEKEKEKGGKKLVGPTETIRFVDDGLDMDSGFLEAEIVGKTGVEERKARAWEMTKKRKEGKKRFRELTDEGLVWWGELQDGFEWNIALRVVGLVDRLLGWESNEEVNYLILKALDILQGALLLHPPSRKLFGRECNMTILLDLLHAGEGDGANGSNTSSSTTTSTSHSHTRQIVPIQCSTLLLLVCALLDVPKNARVFEHLDGLPTITSLFKKRSTPREVKLKCLEFLYFYLMKEPEPVGYIPPPLANSCAGKYKEHFRTRGENVKNGRYSTMVKTINVNLDMDMNAKHGASNHTEEIRVPRSWTRSTEEKQALLGEYLSNVDDLVADLNEA